MQLTIYYKEDDQWLVEKIEAKAYGDRKSVSQVILTILDGYFKEHEDESSGPSPDDREPRKKPGPQPGSRRKVE